MINSKNHYFTIIILDIGSKYHFFTNSDLLFLSKH